MFIFMYGIISGIKPQIEMSKVSCKSVALLYWWQTKYAAFQLAMWFSKFRMSLTMVYNKLKCTLYWCTLKYFNVKISWVEGEPKGEEIFCL